jgi:hypothetical protein
VTAAATNKDLLSEDGIEDAFDVNFFSLFFNKKSFFRL